MSHRIRLAQGSRCAALDGLRGVAVLAVMLFHLITVENGYGSDAWITRKIVGLADNLWAGVDIFFVLSGFLITGILLRTKQDEGYFRKFFFRRALRIVPAYYATLAVVFFVLPHFLAFDTPPLQRIQSAQAWVWGYAQDVSFLVANEDFWDTRLLWLGHFWSLAVEEHFYMFWPLVIFFCQRRTAIKVSIALIVITPLLRAWMLLEHFETVVPFTQTFSRTDELAMGALVALLAQDLSYERIAGFARWGMAASAAYLLTAVVIQHGPLWWEHWTILGPGLTAVGLGAVGLLVLALSPEGNPLSRMLETRVLQLLGKYSYGIYLVHVPMQPLYLWLFPPAGLGARATALGVNGATMVGVVGFVILGSACSTGLAVASFHLYEQPILRLKRFFGYEASERG